MARVRVRVRGGGGSADGGWTGRGSGRGRGSGGDLGLPASDLSGRLSPFALQQDRRRLQLSLQMIHLKDLHKTIDEIVPAGECPDLTTELPIGRLQLRHRQLVGGGRQTVGEAAGTIRVRVRVRVELVATVAALALAETMAQLRVLLAQRRDHLPQFAVSRTLLVLGQGDESEGERERQWVPFLV